MEVLAYDTETCLIRPGVLAPELVCVTYQYPDKPAGIFHHTEAKDRVEGWLNSDLTLVGQNVAFDMAVFAAKWPDLLKKIFYAYRSDRVTDTMLRQKLLDIAAGCYRGRLGDGNEWIKYDYSLEALTRRFLGRQLDKDTWRLRYGELIDTPLSEWPEGARTYPLDDARCTLSLWQMQEPHAEIYLKDQYRQARAAFALHLSSCRGLRTTPEGVEIFRAATCEAWEEVKERLVIAGLVRKNGVRDTKAAAAHMIKVCQERGLPLRRTKKEGISLDHDACEMTNDVLLKDYADYSILNAVISKDIPKLLVAGTCYPVQTRYDLAETGRTTSSNPNIQNLRRKKGIREAFVPRDGYWFTQADYPSLELHTLGQACKTLLGFSKLQEALNAGRDAHTEVAATILSMEYAEALARKKEAVVDAARQTGKVANFGFPGGLGADKLVLFARKAYKVHLTEADALRLKAQWMQAWPEMREYFAYVDKLVNRTGGTIEQLFTGRIRGGCSYNAACNSFFQGLGADIAKGAMFTVSEACYTDTRSPLYGSRIVAFVHDEIICESPIAVASDAAKELARLMREAGLMYLPDDTGMDVEPQIMTVWSKEAKAVYDAHGGLLPWSPELS